MIAGDKRRGVIELRILPDDVPELDETFTVTLTRVEGGADVDSAYNVSTFIIKYVHTPLGLTTTVVIIIIIIILL